MIVGTCEISPAPTTSPIAGPSSRSENAVLDVAVEIEAPRAALAADAADPVAPEGCGEIAHEEAVDPDGPGRQPSGDALGPVRAAGHQGRREAVLGVVGHRDALLLAAEGLQREDRTEDLLADDLGARAHVGEDRGPVVGAAGGRVELV